MLGRPLDKAQQTSDWERRPLDPAQALLPRRVLLPLRLAAVVVVFVFAFLVLGCNGYFRGWTSSAQHSVDWFIRFSDEFAGEQALVRLCST